METLTPWHDFDNKVKKPQEHCFKTRLNEMRFAILLWIVRGNGRKPQKFQVLKRFRFFLPPHAGASVRPCHYPQGRRWSRSQRAAGFFEAHLREEGATAACGQAEDGEMEAHHRLKASCSSSPWFLGFDPRDLHVSFGRHQDKVILCFLSSSGLPEAEPSRFPNPPGSPLQKKK